MPLLNASTFSALTMSDDLPVEGKVRCHSFELWKVVETEGRLGLGVEREKPRPSKLGRGTLTLILTLSALKADGETDLPETTSFFGGLC